MNLFEKVQNIFLISSFLLLSYGLANRGVQAFRGPWTDAILDDKTADNTRIIGGEEAKKFQFPWIVHVSVKANAGNYSCGGCVISENWILTAGHCVYDFIGMEAATIVAGVIRRSDKNEEGRQERTSSQIIMHQGYKEGTKDDPPEHDIALIKLSSPLQLNDAVKAILIANSQVNDTQGTVVTAGWGRTRDYSRSTTEELRTVELSIVDRDFCQEQYHLRPGKSKPQIKSNEICAAGPGKGPCSGDSGGPLICTQGNWRYVCGILSWDIGCANSDFPAVYVRVKSYQYWIMQNGSSNFWCDPILISFCVATVAFVHRK